MADVDRTKKQFSLALSFLSSVSAIVLAICAVVYVKREPLAPVQILQGSTPSAPNPDRTLVSILAQLAAIQEKLAARPADEKAQPAGLLQQHQSSSVRETPASNVTVVIEGAKAEGKCCGDGRLVDASVTVSKSTEASLNVYTSVWYPTSDSSDDRGEVEKTIVPRLREYIGGRAQKCKVFVDGNADSVGSDGHNAALSRRRAEAVSQKLSVLGVEVAKSASSERNHMKVTGDNADQLYNRRTDIHLTCG